MRPGSSRAPNPDFQDPRLYLARGLTGPDGNARPELLTVLAAATGRELLMRAVPLEVVEGVARTLAKLSREALPIERLRASLLERARDPRLQRHRLLLRLLQAGAAAVKTPADLQAFARHVARAHQLAMFERVLGRAIALEQAAAQQRSRRSAGVRAHSQRRRPGPR